MAINITATTLTTETGFDITSCHMRVAKRELLNESSIRLQLVMYKDEAAYLAGDTSFWVDEIPNMFQNIRETLTPAQYANVDNSVIQGVISDLIEQGDSHISWDNYFAGQTYSGLVGTFAVVMPS